MPRSLDLNARYQSETWAWHAPMSDLPVREYSAEIMRNARRYAKAPQSLPYRAGTGELRPMRQHDGGYVIALCYMSGTGWGGETREAVATWEGGKRWTLAGHYRGKAENALAYLALPMHDGRYLLRNAPAKPERGIAKWKARWTVAKRELAGLTAVVGEGIDDSAVQKRMQVAIDTLLARQATQQARYESAVAQLAELPPMHDVAINYGRLRARLLRWCNVSADDANYANMRRVISNRRSDTFGRRFDAAIARAGERAWPYSNTGTALTYGVRCTQSDGTPNHRGPFNAAHEVGVTATAPDWDARPACGNGLHYIPFFDQHGHRRDHGSCVEWSLRYGSNSDFALWIVKAGPARVMIDGEKAKAHSLTPVECIARVRANDRDHSKILKLLVDFEGGARTREELARNRDDAERFAAEYARQAKALIATLRDYRKARKA